MNKTEQVWLALAEDALSRHERLWPRIDELAATLGFAKSTVHEALEHPSRIGAIATAPRSGLWVTNPEKLIVLLEGRRNRSADTVGTELQAQSRPGLARMNSRSRWP